MIFYIFIVFFILIVIFCLPKNIETFDVKYNLLDGMNLQDQRFQSFNQNVTKNWLDKPVAYNYPTVQEYGTSFNDLYKFNQYIFNDFKKDKIDKFVKLYSKDFIFLKKDYLFSYTPFDILNINKDTWYNRYNWNPNMVLYQDYIESIFEEVNIMNKDFLFMFNDYFSDFIGDYEKKKVNLYKPYFIVKYRIVNIYQNKKKVIYKGKKYSKDIIYEIITVITRDNGYLAYSFKLFGLSTFSKGKCSIQKIMIRYISNYTLDQLLIRPNINKDNLYFNINPLYQNDKTLNKSQNEKVFKEEKKRIKEMKNSLGDYACFTFNKDDKKPFSVPMYSLDKNDCQNRYNPIGYLKPYGVWDKPCVKDEECMFYKENKNYKNDFGRCIAGKCQMPTNMKNLGYHYYINHRSTKPLCYNCDSKEWLPYTKLDFCCEEQKDKKKYPFLQSPDYAFPGDDELRMNNYLQEKCKMKPLYDNIFEKTNIFKIDCDGYMDSYFLQQKKDEKNNGVFIQKN